MTSVAKQIANLTQHNPSELQDLLSGSPYLNYLYSYPHKTAYRAFDEKKLLDEVWQDECKEHLFLYVHIPFCEMRCGYCNLFTTTHPKQGYVKRYLDQLELQAKTTKQALGASHFAQLALGGGTPTYLTANELQRLFRLLEDNMHVDLSQIPVGIETSPATSTEDRLQALKDNHVNRVSIGIESFSVQDAKAIGRPQKTKEVQQALDLINQADFDVLNIDLIYGAEGQSQSSWLESIQQAIESGANEIYLYPLYVRPLTGLGRKGQKLWDDQRMALYFAGMDYLVQQGFKQHSMRMFKKHDSKINGEKSHNKTIPHAEYHCQEDGMVGLGCGARSYTRSLHYSFDYAVKKQSVLSIIDRYNKMTEGDFRRVVYGIELNSEEQYRRYVMLSLFQIEGLSRLDYQNRFGEDVLDHFPMLQALVAEGLATITSDNIQLNETGVAWSDMLSTWLFSSSVKRRMDDWQWR